MEEDTCFDSITSDKYGMVKGVKFECDHFYSTYIIVATNNEFIKYMCRSNYRILNKIAMLLCEYSYVLDCVVQRHIK